MRKRRVFMKHQLVNRAEIYRLTTSLRIDTLTQEEIAIASEMGAQ